MLKGVGSQGWQPPPHTHGQASAMKTWSGRQEMGRGGRLSCGGCLPLLPLLPPCSSLQRLLSLLHHFVTQSQLLVLGA